MRAFTLIEVLVVVAIIALLVAILMPSLARARAQAQMIHCQSNMRQLMTAFLTYSVEYNGRLPSISADADWLGGGNNDGTKHFGRQPEDGTIFRYVGKDKRVYNCAEDKYPRHEVQGQNEWWYSYTFNALLNGARVEMLAGAHAPTHTFNRDDHRFDMKSLDGVPVIMEEDPTHFLVGNKWRNWPKVDDGSWTNEDALTDRHLKTGSTGGWANLAYARGHVGRVKLPPPPTPPPGDVENPSVTLRDYFHSMSLCVRTTGGKWVSSRQIGGYGYLDQAPRAQDVHEPGVGIAH